MGKLDGKVAIITGAARGIGKQIALTFAREGAHIVIGDRLVKETEVTAREIRALGVKALTVEVDVSKKPSVQHMVDTVMNTFGKVDILVNNAGVTRHAPLLEMSEDDWDTVLSVNLKGAFLCTQAVGTQMVKRRYGKIISLSSVSGVGSMTKGIANYATSKAGIVMLTKVAAYELGPFGINVNAMAPGRTATDIAFTRRTPEQVKQWIEEGEKLTVLGKLTTTQDIANLALFLASDDAGIITGQVIIADGGRADRM